jgi:hypothetical protein
MQRQNRISIRTYVLASTGILLIGVSLGMLWYWSLDEEDNKEGKTEEKITTEKTKQKSTETIENKDDRSRQTMTRRKTRCVTKWLKPS